MWAFLEHLSYWDWLALGTLLLIFEVFGAGGYLLWVGLAAAAVGVLTLIIPGLPWPLQFLLFGVFSVLTAVFWWKRQRSASGVSDQPGLNERGHELLGRVFLVHSEIARGAGKIKAGDSVWMVTGPDAPVGTRVKVIGQTGVILHVELAD